MSTLTIKFVDFYNSWNADDNFIVRALKSKYDVVVLKGRKEVPQLLFYSFNGWEHLRYDCIRVYFSCENDVPDFNECDYAISSRYIDFEGRHLRYPLFAQEAEYRNIVAGKVPLLSDEEALNRPFCSCVISNFNAADPMRERIFNAINEYKQVASGGRFRNNTGGPVANKMEFISQYKFNIAAENSSAIGYTTEKLVEPMAAGTVPIYWGNPMVSKEFNKESFIDISDYSTLQSAVDAIAKLDSDNEAYTAMLRAPKLLSDKVIDWDGRLADFLCHIVATGIVHRLDCGIQLSMSTHKRAAQWLYSSLLLRKTARFFTRRGGK